jgi:hypothetical protein
MKRSGRRKTCFEKTNNDDWDGLDAASWTQEEDAYTT